MTSASSQSTIFICEVEFLFCHLYQSDIVCSVHVCSGYLNEESNKKKIICFQTRIVFLLKILIFSPTLKYLSQKLWNGFYLVDKLEVMFH